MSNLHKAVINGNIERARYYFYHSPFSGYHTINRVEDFIREESLWEGELDLPIMNHGDVIYIKELDLKVRITSCLRTTDNKFIYSSTHTKELIEDDITKASKEEAENSMEKFKAILERRKVTVEDVEELSWFKKLFKRGE